MNTTPPPDRSSLPSAPTPDSVEARSSATCEPPVSGTAEPRPRAGERPAVPQQYAPGPAEPGGAGAAASEPREPAGPAEPGGAGAAASEPREPAGPAEPLDHPDPQVAAQAAATENLLRCWVRETRLGAPADGVLRIPLPATGVTLLAPVRHWSPTGWHRFGPPSLHDAPTQAPTLDAVTLAALLAREAGSGLGSTRSAAQPSAASSATSATAVTGEAADLVARVADSVRRTAAFLGDRRSRPTDGPDLFLAAEQALVLGHPLHPTPKSREGLTESEGSLYSPELRGSFPLHWIAVSPAVLATDSAWTERGRVVPAPQLTARLAGPGLPLPDGHAALPLHPWQMREIRNRPETAPLFDAGLLKDLGAHGAPWSPTSSVRTVHRTAAPAMLKLSLGLRITNSRRENLRKELHRGVEVHRLLRSGLARRWQASHPGFDIVRDPAWLAVDGPDGRPVPGLDVMIRHNPFTASDDVSCVAGLVAPRPWAGASRAWSDDPRGWADNPTGWADAPLSWAEPGTGGGSRGSGRTVVRSRLAALVTRLAGRTGRPPGAVAAEWFLRYLEHVVRPVLWLDAEAGIALEAHQQNTLLLLDPDGWPAGGRHRDNQGYYFRASRRDDLEAQLPGIGKDSDTFVSDEVTDERFAYYLGINNVLGLVGAFGSQRLADERLLLAAFRRFLEGVATGPARLRTSLPARLLDSPDLRCKANLLTRLHGLDELVGPVDTQSVYVTIANPLRS
ncbi:IucA/IucC family protein [Streptomyces sp. NPDC053367]|uniref:IucA/IucC family protein n=1 Tax=Streptomyces sp. NPDC053367 TaxID=3365700 RepID=UPI0037D97CB6